MKQIKFFGGVGGWTQRRAALRHIGLVLALLALIQLGLPPAGLQASAAQGPGEEQSPVTDPVYVNLSSIEMLSETEGWIVGNHIAFHWNGAVWQSMPLPIYAKDVAIVSTTEAWVVGRTDDFNAAVYRWNGTAWLQIPFQTFVYWNGARTITMISSNDGWISGDDGVYKWDGVTWRWHALFPQGYASAAGSSSDVWISDNSSPDDPRLIYHWGGTQWSLVNGPTDLRDIREIALTNPLQRWVIGYKCDDDKCLSSSEMVVRGDGAGLSTVWTDIPFPADQFSFNGGLWSSDQAGTWVASLTNDDKGAILRWSQGSWSVTTMPVNNMLISDLAMLSTTHGWAIANKIDDHRAMIWEWKNNRWQEWQPAELLNTYVPLLLKATP